MENYVNYNKYEVTLQHIRYSYECKMSLKSTDKCLPLFQAKAIESISVKRGEQKHITLPCGAQ